MSYIHNHWCRINNYKYKTFYRKENINSLYIRLLYHTPLAIGVSISVYDVLVYAI